MSDSVDRVFAHALNTVKKLPRLGTSRPPPEARLLLYGLYKQSMEGDITGIMDRPQGDSEAERAEQDKWDSWHAQKGLSRTEAKRQYITTLIETMHRYASTTADARELVSELEFVWDQVKSNSNPSSDSSSHGYRALRPSLPGRFESNYDDDDEEEDQQEEEDDGGQTLRVLSPVSDGQMAEGEDQDEETQEHHDDAHPHSHAHAGDETEDDEFVDAHESSLVAANDGPRALSPTPPPPAPKPNSSSGGGGVVSTISAYLQKRPAPAPSPAPRPSALPPPPIDSTWARRIEAALIKLNTEMAALRESLDAAAQHQTPSSSILPLPLPSFHRRPSSPAFPRAGGATAFSARAVARGLLAAAWRGVLAAVRHVAVDALVVAVVTLLLHWRGVEVERVEEVVARWIRRIRALTLMKRLERVKMVRLGGLPALPRALTGRAGA